MLPFIGMCGVLGTWCLLALIFLGCGQAITRLLGLEAKGWRNTHLCFWMGWAACIVVLQLWHLKFAVDDHVLLLITMFGVSGLALEAKPLLVEMIESWRCANRTARFVAVLAGSAVLLYWAALAIGPPYRPDTANYHLAGVRWASQYPVIPGLGNLHHRLAFNNSSFLYAAMLDVGPWTNRSHHLAHGLLAVVTLLFFMSRIPRLRDTQKPRYPLYLIQAFFFPIAFLFSYKGTTSYQPDLITFMLGLIVASLLFELLLDKTLSTDQVRLNVFAACLLSSVGLTVKLSFLVFGCFSSCIALLILWRVSRRRGAAYVGLVTVCCVAAGIAIVPWVGRNLILSGYAIYPSHRIWIDVPWRVPVADAQMASDSIVGYARHHGVGYMETLDNWDWVVPALWRELGDPIGVTIPLICILSTLVGFLFARNRRAEGGMSNATLCVFLTPAVLAVLFMVCTAPCPRFAGASIWVLAAGLMIGDLSRLDRSSAQFQRGSRTIIALGIGLFAVGIVKSSRYVQSPFGDTMLAPMPAGDVQLLTTNSGVPVFVGKDGSWDAPLPNTPEFRPNLAFVNETDVRFGFKIVPDLGPEEWIATDSSAATTIR